LYSVGPSGGSASSFAIPQFPKMAYSALGDGCGWHCPTGEAALPCSLGVVALDVDHGEETLGGSGSYVKTDAMAFRRNSNALKFRSQRLTTADGLSKSDAGVTSICSVSLLTSVCLYASGVSGTAVIMIATFCRC